MSDLTELEAQDAAELFTRAQPLMALVAMQFSADELALMERSLDELAESMRGRQVLAELFGRSAFNQTDQNIAAKMPALRAFITLCREVVATNERSQLQVYGEDIFNR